MVMTNYNIKQLLEVCREHNIADDKTLRLFACYCARSVLHHISDQKNRDIFQKTIEVAERFAHGLATKKELEAARSAANSAAGSAARSAARSTVNSVAYYAAYYVAGSAARSAADYAAHSAAYSAADYAAYYAAHYAAYSAAKQQYALHLLEMVPRLKKMLVWL
jgi:hypothetical protein